MMGEWAPASTEVGLTDQDRMDKAARALMDEQKFGTQIYKGLVAYRDGLSQADITQILMGTGLDYIGLTQWIARKANGPKRT